MKFKQTWAEQRRIERSFRQKEKENDGDNRKVMFGLIRPKEGEDETKQPGFIKTAALFRSKEEQENINQMEKDAKEMAKDFDDQPGSRQTSNTNTPNSRMHNQVKLVKSGSFSVNSQENLGPLERRTKQHLCNRALRDYSLVETFN